MNNNTSTSPAQSYADAVRRIEALQALDNAPEVDPRSAMIFLSHGARTERAILLLHGYTSSPRCYIKLAAEFFQVGYNVLVPRFPYHGMKDRMTTALANQTGQELLSFTNSAMDIMQGLGEQVTVAGLSMGGVLTLWAATHRDDISLACAIAPALAFHAIPLALTAVAAQSFLLLPDQFRWWDEKTRDEPLPPLHAYPRYATHGLAQFVRIGLKIRGNSRHTPPRAGSVLMVLNPTDEHVNNAYAHEIVEHWNALGAPGIRLYEFDAHYKLKHDLIDPDQADQQTDLVYPILLELITGKPQHTL